MSNVLFYIDGLGPGADTVFSSADGTISVVPPVGDPPPEFVVYTVGPVPTIPAGSMGLLIDQQGGTSLVEPDNYVATLDLAQGSTTIVANPDIAQTIYDTSSSGPITVSETGGTQPIYVGGETAVLGLQGAGGGTYLFGGGSHSIELQGGANKIIAAGGSASFQLYGSTNMLNLQNGSYSVSGQGGDIIAAGSGNYSLDEAPGGPFFDAPGSNLFLRDGTYVATVLGGSSVFLDSGSASLTTFGAGVLIDNTDGSVVMTIDNYVYLPGGTPAGAAQSDTVFGGAGSITVSGAAFRDDEVNDGSSPQIVLTDPANDFIVGGSTGHNLITARSYGTTIFGGGNGDVLEGWVKSPGGDIIVAGPGAESIFSNGSIQPTVQDPFNTIKSAPSGNLLVGGSGSDLIVGGPEHDTILAGTGATTISTGIGGSLLQLGVGGDLVNLAGADTVFAGGGSATIGGGGGDHVFGGAGAFTFVNGAAATSTVTGGAGSATIYAGAGGGVFAGGIGGNNILVGGAGHTVFFGGSGTGNLFDFANGSGGGSDVIADFDPSRDRVALTGFAPGTAVAALAAATISGGSMTIALPDATRITFLDVTRLDPASFS